MKIITELSLEELKQLRQSVDGIIILKFSAKWCSPCSKIEPYLHKYMRDIETANLPFTFCFLDVDICPEIYRYFKTKKIAPGIPTIMSFHNKNMVYGKEGSQGNQGSLHKNAESFYPDNVVVGADILQIEDFFKKEIQTISATLSK